MCMKEVEESKMKLLMHACCGPCSVYCIDSLRGDGIEPTIYWYNPNIHPYKEYEARKNSLIEYTTKKRSRINY